MSAIQHPSYQVIYSSDRAEMANEILAMCVRVERAALAVRSASDVVATAKQRDDRNGSSMTREHLSEARAALRQAKDDLAARRARLKSALAELEAQS